MRDMLIDLKLAGKTVLIFGGGNTGEKKAKKFSQANSTVVVVSKNFTNDLKRLGQQEKLKLVEAEVEVNSPSTTSLISKSDLIIAATDNPKLNEDITKEARKRGILVCAVDRPSISDFHLPAIAHVGEIRIAVSTGGKSPAMARILRKRVEENHHEGGRPPSGASTLRQKPREVSHTRRKKLAGAFSIKSSRTPTSNACSKKAT